MKEAFSDVYLVWKPATSEDRFLIGVVSKQSDRVTFRYNKDEVMRASRCGFIPYIEFRDIDKVYDKYVIEIFSQRLTPKSRFKTASVFKFWEISEEILEDRLATIAFTQAMLPTDNFEFLADFYPEKGLSFITDLSALKLNYLPGELLEVGDPLIWQTAYTDDSSDQQILVKYDNVALGYVKRVHSNVFKNYRGNIRLRVHSIEKREYIKRVFVKVELL